MKASTRNILVVAGIVGVLIIGVVAYGAYSLYTSFGRFMVAKEIPGELNDARVLKGEADFSRTEFFKVTKENYLKIVSDGVGIKDEKEREKMVQSQVARGIYGFADIKVVGEEIVAVGNFGAFVFDLSGNPKRQIFLEPDVEKIKIGPYEQDNYRSSLDNLSIVRLEKDKIGFLSFGLSQGVRVFDEHGNQIWSAGKEIVDFSVLTKGKKELAEDYEKSTHVLGAAVGDLDNDGVAEYIVARKNDGIRAYHADGSEDWFQPNNFPHKKLQVFDLDGDGKNELIEIGESVRDGNGKVLREIKNQNGGNFILAEDKTGKPVIQFLDIYTGSLTCSGENGETILKGPAPLSEIKLPPKRVDVPGYPEMSYTDDGEHVSFPKGVWVSFRKDKPKYLAVVAAFIGIPRADLYIYEPNGNLVYHQLLDEEAETIAVLPASNGNESILVGGKNTIWKYSAN